MVTRWLYFMFIFVLFAINIISTLSYDATKFFATIAHKRDINTNNYLFYLERDNTETDDVWINIVLAKSPTKVFYDTNTQKFAPEADDDFTYAFRTDDTGCPGQNKGSKLFTSSDHTYSTDKTFKFGKTKTWPSEWKYVYIITGTGKKLTTVGCNKNNDFQGVYGPYYIHYRSIYLKSCKYNFYIFPYCTIYIYIYTYI